MLRNEISEEQRWCEDDVLWCGAEKLNTLLNAITWHIVRRKRKTRLTCSEGNALRTDLVTPCYWDEHSPEMKLCSIWQEHHVDRCSRFYKWRQSRGEDFKERHIGAVEESGKRQRDLSLFPSEAAYDDVMDRAVKIRHVCEGSVDGRALYAKRDYEDELMRRIIAYSRDWAPDLLKAERAVLVRRDFEARIIDPTASNNTVDQELIDQYLAR